MAGGFPLVCAISGSQDFLQRRQVASTIELQRKQGWRVQVVEGSDAVGLNTAVLQGGGMFEDETSKLVVVRNPEKSDLSVLEQHLTNKTSHVMVLLDIVGEPKANSRFGKFVAGLGPKAHVTYPVPEKKWEAASIAAKFCTAEAQRYGKTLADDIAEVLVKRCGTNYGFLAFEIQKYAILAEARGQDKIRAEELRDAMATLGEVSLDGVKEALAAKNAKRLASALERVRKGSKDPVMGLCGFLDALILGRKSDSRNDKPSVGWIHLSVLVSQGKGFEQIAAHTGLNPWFCQKQLLPEVKAWSPKDLIQLLQAVSATRRGVLTGQSDPWTGLVARLLYLCR